MNYKLKIRYHYPHSRIIKIKKMIIQSVGKYVEKQEFSYIASRIIKLCSHFIFLVSSKFKHILTIWHSSITFGHLREMNTCVYTKICI